MFGRYTWASTTHSGVNVLGHGSGRNVLKFRFHPIIQRGSQIKLKNGTKNVTKVTTIKGLL